MELARRCGWRHEFNSLNMMGLESASPLQSLSIGTLWHKGLDSSAQREMMLQEYGEHKWIAGSKNRCDICGFDMYSHAPKPLEIHGLELLAKIRFHYKEVSGRDITPFELKPTFDNIALVRAMYTNYINYWGTLLPKDFIYIQPEQQMYRTIPGTSHCSCYYKNKCECGWKCRYKHTRYTYCKCLDTQCSCRQEHTLEGTVDGLILHVPTKNVYILENKSFSVHANKNEARRTPQFTGYVWLAEECEVRGLMYNGAWTRAELPDKRKWDDMFPRYTVDWKPNEISTWVQHAAITALAVFDPEYVPIRVVHPVGGCNGVNGCDFKTLCDARFNSNGYEVILKNEYRRRTDKSAPSIPMQLQPST